jgi:hypothetical protein
VSINRGRRSIRGRRSHGEASAGVAATGRELQPWKPQPWEQAMKAAACVPVISTNSKTSDTRYSFCIFHIKYRLSIISSEPLFFIVNELSIYSIIYRGNSEICRLTLYRTVEKKNIELSVSILGKVPSSHPSLSLPKEDFR